MDSVSVSKIENSLKADGDGKYDFMFAFSESGNQFTTGEIIVFDITYSGGTMNTSSFDYLSSPAGGHGPFYSAAHVQNTGVGESGWIVAETTTVVPEPVSSTLFIIGSAAFGIRRFWNKNS